ncbi:MAG: ABC-F family ATP-binding cassette domain-containing protein [Lachnospiraceae bacterium]|jgi:ATP-binding cassette subfamily F protein 3
MILTVSHISKSFSEVPVIRDGSFFLEDHEKAAVVGINGAGKSTLLKMITGILPPDSGSVSIAKDARIGYLAQHQDTSRDITVWDLVMETRKDLLALETQMRELEERMKSLSGTALETALEQYDRMSEAYSRGNGYAVKSEVTGTLRGLGFTDEDFTKKVSTLSGGQKTRASLAALLMSRPEILLLDEPTNHLDIHSLTWLETYLVNYSGAVIVVSHDRYFLDRVVKKVIEVENGEVTVFSGNYSDYSAKKEALRESRMKAYLNQQAEIRHQEEVIEKLRSFNREKSIRRAQSREKMLSRVERITKPIELDDTMQIHLEPAVQSGNDVLIAEGLTKSYGAQNLFSDVNILIRRGEKVAVIGDNGTGKTTLMKIINGLVRPDSGSFRLGANVTIGYYDQEQNILNPELTLFEQISDEHPQMTNTEVRNLLAGFLFTGDDVFKRVSDLSGGEKGRLSLALLMLSDANFIILDEPTNHLDMTSRSVLEMAIRNYTGTVLYVSHDRYFINQTATRILELRDHTFTEFLGNYDYYLQKREEMDAAAAASAAAREDAGRITASREDWQQQKKAAAEQRRMENDMKRTEARIAELEQQNREADAKMEEYSAAGNVNGLIDLQKQKEAAETELSALYDRWEKLSEQLENR